MAYIDNISVFWKLVKRYLDQSQKKNGSIETNNKASSGREILAWRLSTKFHAVNIAASCTLRSVSLSLDSMCSRRVLPLTCYFSDLRFEKDAFVTPYVNDKCTNVSERVLNEISLDNEITIAASFSCIFNISLTIFLSTGCYFN